MTISELTLKTRDEEPVRRFEVFTRAGRRRDWSDEEKAQIVSESYSTDVTVCAVARRHGLSPQQLFTWRRLFGNVTTMRLRLLPCSCQRLSMLPNVFRPFNCVSLSSIC